MNKSTRNILLGTLLFVPLFLVAFYNPRKADPPHTLYIAMNARAKGIHTGMAGYYETVLVTKVADPLYGYDEHGKIVPLLADGMPVFSQEGCVVTIKIKKGIHWPDHPAFKAHGGKGRELVVDDVIHTLLRSADPAFPNINYNTIEFLGIEGLGAWRKAAVDNHGQADYTKIPAGFKKTDPYTLEIHLDAMCSERDFTATMAMCSHITPPEGLAYFGHEGSYSHPIGLGPFKLVGSYRASAPRVDFVRNESYYGKQPKAEKLVIKIMEEASTMKLAFEKGELDVLEVKPESVKEFTDEQGQLKEAYRKKGWKLLRTEKHVGIKYLTFNTQKKGLDDVRVRRALALAFTPDEYLSDIYRGYEEVQLFAYEGLEGHDPTYRNPYRQGGQLEKAKELIAQADPEGKGFPVYKLFIPEGTLGRQRAEHVQLCAQKIGIQIEIRQCQWGEFLGKCMEEPSEMDLMMLSEVLDWESVYIFLKLFYSPYIPDKGFNVSRFKHPEFDALFKAFKTAKTADQKDELARKMLVIVAEEVPSIPIGAMPMYYIVQPWVKGFHALPTYASPSASHFVEIDEEEKAIRLGRKEKKNPQKQ